MVSRERIIELIGLMKLKTVDNGCTPGEAAKFAAKVADLVEKYQIQEAELRAEKGDEAEDIEVAQNLLRTGKRVFNPGMTQVVNGLATGMSCRCILLHQRGEAVYGIVGEVMDCDFVCQIATSVVPALRIMAAMEGAEHSETGGGLVKWTNQYLTGAGLEICQRLKDERKERSRAKEVEHARSCTALVLVTGDSLAKLKAEAATKVFEDMYPVTRKTQSRSEYNHTAHTAGREAGKRVGLNLAIE